MSPLVAACALVAASLHVRAHDKRLAPGVPSGGYVATAIGDRFRVDLQAGQFFHATVNQHELDLAVCLYDPNGVLVAESQGFEYGNQSISYLVVLTGPYRVAVAPVDSSSRGAFEAVVDIPRAPVPADLVRGEAERLATESMRLAAVADPSQIERARSLNEDALRRWRELGDIQGQTRTLLKLGDIEFAGNRYAEAREHYRAALSLADSIGELAGAARSRNSVAACDLVLGDSEEATRLLREALSKFQESHNRYGIAVASENLAELMRRSGDQDAVAYARGAIRDFEILKKKEALGKALNTLALSYTPMKPRLALPALERSREIFNSLHNIPGQAGALLNIGRVQMQLGQKARAAASERRALEPLRITPDKRLFAEATLTLGRAIESRAPNDAQRMYQSSLEIYRQIGDRRGQASALHAAGRLHAAAGEAEQGLGELESAYALRDVAGIRDSAAESLFEIARILDSKGDLNGASVRLENAIQLTETLRTYIPGEDLRVSYFAGKQVYYELYVDLQMRLGHPAEAFHAAEQAKARALLDLIGQSRNLIRGGIAPALNERRASLERQLNYASQQLIGLSAQPANGEREEASRKRIEGLLAEYDLLETNLREQQPLYAEFFRPQPLTLDQVRDLLPEDAALLEFSFGETRSYFFAITRDAVETFTLPDRASIERQVQPAVELMGRVRDRAREPALQRRFRSAMEDAARIFLGRAGAFRSKPRWIVVGDGVLRLLPLGALRIPGEPAIVESQHQISVLPSASLAGALRSRGASRPPAPKTMAIFADPVFDSLDPRVAARGTISSTRSPVNTGLEMARLAFSHLETRAISGLVPPAQRLVAEGFAASKDRLLAENLGQYRILHVSSHSVLNDRYPYLSGVALSQVDSQGRPRDGFLHLFEIYNLHLAGADLVTLSACQSATGTEVRGEGLLSIARGFLFAGATRVLASLWAVDDEATAALMRRFYANFLGKKKVSPALALRDAQLSIRSEPRWRDPYYWAGFTLIAGPD